MRKPTAPSYNGIGQTAVLALFIFALILVSAEGILRQHSIQARLPAAALSKGYKPFDIYLRYLDDFVHEHGRVDCIFLGNSRVQAALDPQIFAAAYERQTGETLTCFNFGLTAASPSTLAPVAAYLAEKYRPELMIFGTSPQDFNAALPHLEVERHFRQTPWLRYQFGDFSLSGWLLDRVMSYRYLNTVPDVLWSERIQAELWVSPKANGFVPATFYRRNAPLFETISPDPVFERSEPDAASFEKLLGLGINLLIVDIPTFYPPPGAFPDLIQLAHEGGIPFWTAHPTLPLEAWSDPVHLYVSGALVYSNWLGEQVGAARKDGFEAWLDAPPLAESAIQPPQFPMYHAPDSANFLPPDAVILNPSRGLYSRELLTDTLAQYFYWQDVDSRQQERLDAFYHVLAQMRFEDSYPDGTFDAWHSSFLPDELHALGIEYLIYPEIWFSWTTNEEAAILQNPAHYERIAVWQHPALQQDFYLYRVIP